MTENAIYAFYEGAHKFDYTSGHSTCNNASDLEYFILSVIYRVFNRTS